MCYYPITLRNNYRKPNNDSALNTVPCGKCIRCIEKHRTQWAFRLYHEAKDHATAYFITPTYTEEQLPYLNHTTGEYPIRLSDSYETNTYRETDQLEKIVYKKDIQDFIKNVRRQTEYHFKKHSPEAEKETKIRYYFTSEYGTKNTKRPHYHGIIWNLQPPIAKKIELQKIWTKGNITIKPIIDNDIATYYYLSKYMYKQKNLNIWTFKPFNVMSTRPFIGHTYLKTHSKYHIQKGDLLTKFNNRTITLPRQYRIKLPQYLTDNTNKKILEYNKELEKKELHLAEQRENHHPDILKYFKQQTKENKDKLEKLVFKQKFRNYVNI